MTREYSEQLCGFDRRSRWAPDHYWTCGGPELWRLHITRLEELLRVQHPLEELAYSLETH